MEVVSKLKKMSTEREFYITLPSNVKSNDDTNILSEYKTQLTKRYELPQNEDWRVGLAEILYTQTWYNVRKKSKIKFLTEDGAIVEDNIFNISYTGYREENSPYYIQPGYYRDIESLIFAINQNLALSTITNSTSNEDVLPKLSFNHISNKVTIECGSFWDFGVDISSKKSYIPIFEPDIEKMLGLFDEEKVKLFDEEDQRKPKSIVGESLIFGNVVVAIEGEINGKKKETESSKKISLVNSKKEKIKLSFSGKEYHTAHKPAEINAGFNSMYIYTDIVQHSSVGDAYAQLLRNIPVKENVKWGEAVHVPFDKPHLIPVQSRNFDTIQIDISDDAGRIIPFESGRVLIKLLFKKYD